jgi:negative regulator of flagellin synthesis FlgM
MKIENSGKPLTSVSSRPTDTTSVTRSKNAESAAATVSNEGVSTSASPFDAEKVAKIRQAIAEGRFNVRTDAVADKLLDSVKELLAK